MISIMFIGIFITFSGCLDISLNNNLPNNNYSYENPNDFLNNHEYFTAKVIKITDGDTIWVMAENGTKYKIRLLGVDTPEIYHENIMGVHLHVNPYRESGLCKNHDYFLIGWLTTT